MLENQTRQPLNCTLEMAESFGVHLGEWIAFPKRPERPSYRGSADRVRPPFYELCWRLRDLLQSNLFGFDLHSSLIQPLPLRSLDSIFETSGTTGLVTDIEGQMNDHEDKHGFRFVGPEELIVPVDSKTKNKLEPALACAYYEVGLYLKPSPHKGPEGMYIVPFLLMALRGRIETALINRAVITSDLRAMIKGNLDGSRRIWAAVTEDNLKRPFQAGAWALGRRS